MSTKQGNRRGRGRKTKLTPEVQRKIVHVVEMGGSLKMAANYAGVSHDAVYEWIRRGEGHDHREPDERFIRFAKAVRKAEGDGDAKVLQSVRSQVEGLPCKACDGGIIETAEGPDRCPACKGSGYAARPDGRLGLEVLARRHPADYGRKDRMQVDQKVEATVDVNVTAQALVVNLQALDVAQLQALAWAQPAGLIEAEDDRG